VPEFPPRGEEQKSVSELSFFAKPMTDVSGRALLSLGHLRGRFWAAPRHLASSMRRSPRTGRQRSNDPEITRFGIKRTAAVTSAPA
jgi:hypothetical protein